MAVKYGVVVWWCSILSVVGCNCECFYRVYLLSVAGDINDSSVLCQCRWCVVRSGARFLRLSGDAKTNENVIL